MRKLNRMLALLFVFALALSMTAFAADEGTFNAAVEISYESSDMISVMVPSENDTVLKNQKPTLKIKCDFEKAYVKFGEDVILDSDTYALVTEDGVQYIEFEVAAAGTYLILKGEAPVVVTPTPILTPQPTPTATPTPAVTPTPTPVVTPTPTPDPNATGGDVKTGDDSNGALWAAAALLSTTALIAGLVTLRKRANEN